MPAQIDHLILPVNDLKVSVEFYTRILGFEYERERPPFSVIRITADFVIQLAPWGTSGNEHLAFSMTAAEFEETFQRIRNARIAYGDAFDAAENMRGPGPSEGARGDTRSLYLFDPNHHLIEILSYSD
jgi:catechol 2,3-dioxygenase-like lactoylglutathione lyase family enzyme